MEIFWKTIEWWQYLFIRKNLDYMSYSLTKKIKKSSNLLKINEII